MGNFKGTQGKWFIDNGVGVTSINSKRFPAGIDSIATVRNQFHNDQTKANALLISKAPEMLEMLIKVNSSLLNDSSTMEQISLRLKIEDLIKEATEL